MKKRLTGYTFDASEKTVVHADFSDITLEGIQLITNTTDNIIIYNFADATKGGTLSTDTLTLTYDTTSMSDTDKLMILVDDAVTTQTVSGTVTANLSATDNQVLDDIKVDTEAIEIAVEAIQAGQLADGHNVTVDNSTGAAAVNIQDGGNSITVDGTITANLSATDNAVLDQIELNTDPLLVVGSGTEATAQRVTIATDSTGVLSVDDNGSTLSIDDGGGAITVDGTVAVTNAGLTEVAAAINASSQMDVNIAASDISFGGTSAADDADFTDGTTPGTPGMGVYEATPTTVTDGDLGVVGITETRALKVQAQANSGVDIGDVTINNATIAVTQSGTWDEVGINDSGNSITVDATNLDVRDLVAASDAVTVHGDVGVIDQLDLTNSNPAAVAIVDGDGTQITSFGGGTQYSDGDANADPTGTVAMGTDGSNVFAVHTDTSGDLQVDILSIAAGDNNIGNVDVASSALPTGASTAANQTTIIGHVDGIEGLLTTIDTDTGNIDTSLNAIEAGYATEGSALGSGVLLQGDDGTDRTNVLVDTSGHLQVDVLTAPSTAVTNAGTFATQIDGAALTALQLIDNSIYVDDADWTADTSSHTLVGAVTQVATTANTDGDTTPLTTNAMRELRTAVNESDLATAGTAHVKKYYTNAGAVTDGIIWSPAAGKRWYVTDIFINVSAAATVTLEDDLAGGDSPVWKAELAANSGWSHSFNTPLYSGEDAADLIITTTAGNVYVTVTGYEV